jgi:hypothetical protein
VSGARVTPLDGSAADNLADAGGIAALLLPAPGIPVDNPQGWSEAIWPFPGSLLALNASYFYGAHLERLAGEDDR